MPMFSVIIPCFNAEATLAETLDSIIAQSCCDWEVLCVDDGSTDGTVTVIEAFAARDQRIRLVRHDGKGPSAARNAAARLHALGDILAFCDADDLWLHDKLDRLKRLFAARTVAAVFGQVAFFDGRRDARMRCSTVPGSRLTIPMLLGENPVCTLSNLSVRRGWFLHLGGFDQEMIHNEDLEFLIRLVGEGAQVAGDPGLHVLYRASPLGLSADLDRMADGRRIALSTAARYGVSPDARAEAVYARYLARRALRLDKGGGIALHHTLTGLRASPSAFLFPLRRGAATALASLIAPLLPPAARKSLFAAD